MKLNMKLIPLAIVMLGAFGVLAAQRRAPAVPGEVFKKIGEYKGEPILRHRPHGSVPWLTNPPFVPAAQANFMQDDEPVIGVAAHGVAKAYSVWMMPIHEAVNDTIGPDPIVVTWCQICQTGIVYSRKVGNRVLTFISEGVLWHDNEVLSDQQTDSFWSQGAGIGIRGKYKGTKLQYYPSSEMTWKDWRTLHPNTLVLLKQTERDKKGISAAQKAYRTSSRVGFTGRSLIGGALPPKVFVVGFEIKGQPYAVPINDLKTRDFLQVGADGVFVVVVPTADRLSAKVFLAGSHRFTKAQKDGARILLIDQKSGSSWDGLAGLAVSGKLKGQRLQEVPANTGFWFAQYSFNPKTKVLRP